MFNINNLNKGNYGEGLVDQILIKKGIIPYKPVVNRAHPFDRLCATSDKKTLFIAEVKTKARRNWWPDTGFNYSHYLGYREIQEKHRLDIVIFFVDEGMGKIYGGKLSRIAQEHDVVWKGKIVNYPKKEKRIIYFPLEIMTTYADLTFEDIELLKQSSSRSYNYELTTQSKMQFVTQL